MKTYNGWQESGLDLDKFVNPLDEIDEVLYLHYGEIVAPQYCSRDFTQIGEAMKREGEVYFYETVARIYGRYFYLGVLPEFKQ